VDGDEDPGSAPGIVAHDDGLAVPLLEQGLQFHESLPDRPSILVRMPFAGELSCLAAALLWAVAVSMFRRPVVEFGARTVNLAKCSIGALLQGLTVLALGQMGALWDAPRSALLFIAASGIVGLTIGDTALFSAVARIGVHRTLLLQTLSPVFAALLALGWQNEIPTTWEMAGAVVILSGVALVVTQRRAQPEADGFAAPESTPEQRGTGAPVAAGLLLGALAALGQGSGMVLAKAGMTDVPVLPASFLRLSTAAVGLMVLALALRRTGRLRKLLGAPILISRLLPATLLGTYLALFLMMFGVAMAPVAVAATLLSVSPVFGLLIDAFVNKQPVTTRGVAGTLLAIIGVAVLTHG
jgi:drug/metabolite transporter (DMT)-like permease